MANKSGGFESVFTSIEGGKTKSGQAKTYRNLPYADLRRFLASLFLQFAVVRRLGRAKRNPTHSSSIDRADVGLHIRSTQLTDLTHLSTNF
jgi:hypothetical protein